MIQVFYLNIKCLKKTPSTEENSVNNFMAQLFAAQFPQNVNTNLIYDTQEEYYRPVKDTDFFGGTSITNASKDAFGRQRVSEPFTLFDSSHRFKDNNLWSTATTGTASATFDTNEGLVDLTVDNSINSEVVRETTKVFSYQPGKSLLIMNTFVMEPSKTGLRQRVGYYGASNGIYLELANSVLYIVKRSSVSGVLVDTRIAQSSWNNDKLDGTGISGVTLDISKAQILYADIEWLGVGSVRVGFVINGQYLLCHVFNHANIITSTYITTASLPIRYEIKNTAATSGSSTMKQICSTVISEGGYELRGLQQAVTIPLNTPRDCTVANTYYPVISLKLKSGFLDAIVILTALSMLGTGNNSVFNWQMIASGTTTGGSWVDAGANSAVEYNISGTSFSGGRVLASGYLTSSAQGQVAVDILKEALFKFQLERNGLTSTPYELTLIIASKVAGDDVYASIDWEEISR